MISYLKRIVLPTLVRQRWIEKVHSVREMTAEELAARKNAPAKSARKAAEQGMAHEWFWQRRIIQVQNPPKPKEVFGAAVGVGEDISHLNKRRQRSRQEKVAADVEWLHDLEKARREGARAAAGRR